MNKNKKLAKLRKALSALEIAQSALKEVANDTSDNWYLCPDALHFLGKVEDIISCDHGEAGLRHLIEELDRRRSWNIV